MRKRILALLLVALFLYAGSFAMLVIQGTGIGKKYGMDRGYYFVDPDSKNSVQINLGLEFVYAPLVYIWKEFGDMHPIRYDAW